MTTWIIGDGGNAHWHLGVQKPYTHDPKRTYWATACKGKSIGGAFGPSTTERDSPPSELEHLRCKLCMRLYERKSAEEKL